MRRASMSESLGADTGKVLKSSSSGRGGKAFQSPSSRSINDKNQTAKLNRQSSMFSLSRPLGKNETRLVPARSADPLSRSEISINTPTSTSGTNIDTPSAKKRLPPLRIEVIGSLRPHHPEGTAADSHPATPTESPTTPQSAEFRLPSEEEVKRRRLNKLIRTFGEQVPVELVFGQGNTEDPWYNDTENDSSRSNIHKRTHTQSVRQASISIPTLTSIATALFAAAKQEPTIEPKFLPPPHKVLKKNSIKRNRSTNAVRPFQDISVDSNLLPETALLSPIVLKLPSSSPPLENPKVRTLIDAKEQQHVTKSTEDADDQPSPGRPEDFDHSSTAILMDAMRADTPFRDSRVLLHAGANLRLIPGYAPCNGKEAVKRRESRQGWSGEWNQPDIHEVIEKLREL